MLWFCVLELALMRYMCFFRGRVFGCRYQCNRLPGNTISEISCYMSRGTLNSAHLDVLTWSSDVGPSYHHSHILILYIRSLDLSVALSQVVSVIVHLPSH